MPDARGFTLWELLCSLGISALLLGLGVPSFHRFVLDSRRTSDVNAFVLAVQVARTESAKRGEAVVLCPSRDGRRCANDEKGYGAGWIVFYDRDSKNPPQRSDTEPLIYAYHPEISGGSIVGNRPYFDFRPIMRRSTNGTLVFCDERGPPAARAVIVSYTGRPRVDTVAADGARLVCTNSP